MDDGDTVGDEPDDRKVVRDKEICEILLGLELVHKVENLRADGNVQRGDRLVRHDELRVHDHRARDADALTLPAGKLVRVAGLVLGQQADVLKSAIDLCNALLLILIEVEVVQPLGDAVLDGGALVERRRRVLKDHLDVADDVAVLLAGDLAGDALSLKEDLAAAARVDAHDGAAERRFAGAGLADKGERFALIDVKIRVFYGDEFFFASDVEGDVHMLDREDNLSVGGIIRHGRHLPYPSSSGFSRADPEWPPAFPASGRGDREATFWHSGSRSPGRTAAPFQSRS